MNHRFLTLLGLAVLALAVLAPAALASDHLFNAATAPGAAERGFTNPVALNPSGVSGGAAQPGTVPGEGDPNAGQDLTTPAVDLSLVTVRSGGHGEPQGSH
ncbi:MAG: hypothetical protein WC709_02570 [Thermoleophilia bacterium]